MQRRRIPFLVRAVILFIASLPLARAAATSAEARSLSEQHAHEASVAGRQGFAAPLTLSVGATLGVALASVAAHAPGEIAPERAYGEASRGLAGAPRAAMRTVRRASPRLWLARASLGSWAGRAMAIPTPLAADIPPLVPFKGRLLIGALTVRAP